MGTALPDHRDRRDRPSVVGCGGGHDGRHRGAGHRGGSEERQGGAGFFPADGRLRGEVLCGRADPGRLLQA